MTDLHQVLRPTPYFRQSIVAPLPLCRGASKSSRAPQQLRNSRYLGLYRHSTSSKRQEVSVSLEDRLQRHSAEAANDEAYQECSNFLRTLGIDNRAELARVMDIATNPQSIYTTYQGKKGETNSMVDFKKSLVAASMARKISVADDLKPLVEFFTQEGMSQKDIVKVIVEHPPVLCYSPTDRIQPFFKYLSSLGIASPAATIQQRPSLLGLDGEKSLRQIVEYLQQNDYTPEQIEHMLCTSI